MEKFMHDAKVILIFNLQTHCTIIILSYYCTFYKNQFSNFIGIDKVLTFLSNSI